MNHELNRAGAREVFDLNICSGFTVMLVSMETVARQSLYRQTHARDGDLRALADRRLLSRIWRFSARHHRRLGGFVAISVVSALLTVTTPLLAGRVVDAITRGGPASTVVLLAAVIARGGRSLKRSCRC